MAHFSLRAGAIMETCTRWGEVSKSAAGAVPDGWGASPLGPGERSRLHQLEDHFRKLGASAGSWSAAEFSSDDESDDDDDDD